MGMLATDNFSRANGGLGANWTTTTGTGDFAPTIVSEHVETSTIDGTNDAFAYYTGTTWPANQYSQVKVLVDVNAGGAGAVGVICRVNNGGANLYLALVEGPLDTPGGSMYLIKRKDSSQSQFLGTPVIYRTLFTGDIIRLEAIGSKIRMLVNDVLVLEGTDSEFTSGPPGIFVTRYTAPLSDAQIDDWEGGQLPEQQVFIG